MTPRLSRTELLKEKARRDAEAQRDRWRRDPVAFAREALGCELWGAQANVATDVASGLRVSWRASQKVGKSTLFAVLGLWRVHCFDPALVVMTSGNATQVKQTLWPEVRKWHRRAKVPLGGTVNLDPATGLTFEGSERRLIGLTVRDSVRMGGYSDPNILYLVDEASGVEDEVIDACLANAIACGGTIVLAGNPTTTTGYFARTQREKLEGWKLYHTSAFDSPNIKAGRVIIPGIAGPDFPQEVIALGHPPESAFYQIRVLGEYATQQADSVIPFALLEKATKAYDAGARDGSEALEVGVDPAYLGDDESVIQGRVGRVALPLRAHRKLDTMQLAQAVLDYVQTYRIDTQRVIVRVDSGGYGAGVYEVVRRLLTDPAMQVVAINAAQRSDYPNRFVNMRAQLWFSIRRFLENGGTLPADQRQEAELLAAKHKLNAKMLTEVEGKPEMKKRLGRSPDRADALALACLSESPLTQGESPSQWSVYLPETYKPSPMNPWGTTRRNMNPWR